MFRASPGRVLSKEYRSNCALSQPIQEQQTYIYPPRVDCWPGCGRLEKLKFRACMLLMLAARSNASCLRRRSRLRPRWHRRAQACSLALGRPFAPSPLRPFATGRLAHAQHRTYHRDALRPPGAAGRDGIRRGKRTNRPDPVAVRGPLRREQASTMVKRCRQACFIRRHPIRCTKGPRPAWGDVPRAVQPVGYIGCVAAAISCASMQPSSAKFALLNVPPGS